MQEARYRAIGRSPILTVHHSSEAGVMIVGYRRYEVLRAAIARLAPEKLAQA